ncbi:MAG: alpha/beta fold hydrolase, partial [Gaiellaceae bacterium]
MRAPELFDVPVRGGNLCVARWAGREGAPVVMAAHGVTANHRNFALLADILGDEVTLLAPDLRGRCGSLGLGGPFGMRAHAEDMVATLDHLGISEATFLGHSMGGFVVPVAALLFPERVRSVVVGDGGLKVVDLPPGADIEEVARHILGPSMERLRMTFETREAYREFWRPHPALAEVSAEHLDAYLDYDLGGEPGAYRSRVTVEAVVRDSTDTLADEEILDATERVTQPFMFLHAARGIFNETPGLFGEDKVSVLRERVPHVQTALV